MPEKIAMVLAYRPNGCLVGLCEKEEWENKAIENFAHLVSPIKLAGKPRPIIIATANIDEDLLMDIDELIIDVGGADAGFEAAALITDISDFDPETEPYAVQMQPDNGAMDEMYQDENGTLTCPVCGEHDCHWLGLQPQQAEPEPEPAPVDAR